MLVPDMTLTLKKTTLIKMGSSVHLPQRGHVLLWQCYLGQGHLIQGHIGNYPSIKIHHFSFGPHFRISCLNITYRHQKKMCLKPQKLPYYISMSFEILAWMPSWLSFILDLLNLKVAKGSNCQSKHYKKLFFIPLTVARIAQIQNRILKWKTNRIISKWHLQSYQPYYSDPNFLHYGTVLEW